MKKMYRLKLALIYFLMLTYYSYSQNPFQVLNPQPSYRPGLDIQFVNATDGFIINDDYLLKTIDAGLTWQIAQPLVNAQDISIKNSIGFIVGLGGKVYKSTDSGQSWNEISTTFTYNYNTVNIIDSNNIIITSNNKIVKTTDGGNTWTSLSVTGFPSITHSFFTSTLVGHGVCIQGKIIKTIDGGVNWYVTETVSTSPATFLSITFVDQNIGFATREHNKVFKTTNAGESWIDITPPVFEQINRIYFTDQNNGFAAAEDGFIYKTVNGGLSWSTISYIGGNGGASYLGIYFIDNNVGFIVGERGRIAKTLNGGTTWTEYAPSYDDLNKVQFISDNVGYALIYNGGFLKTTDAGSTWQIVGTLNNNGSNFQFINENIGYATSSANGKIYKSSNGGINWIFVNNGNNVLNDGYNAKVYFFNENVGFAMGGFNSPRTAKTINGGATWQQIANYTFSQMQFLTPDIGYALYNGLSKTTDGGITWTVIGTSINAYHVFDENTIYAVGPNTFKKTTDGGVTWQSSTISPLGVYTSMKFYNSQLGYILKDNTAVYRTTNGGQSWNGIGSFYAITSMDLFGTRLSISGEGGVILSNLIPQSLGTDIFADENSQIIVYPNPTHDVINIKSNGNLSITKIDIYDSLGKKIKQCDNSTNLQEISIDWSNNSKGIYLLKIYSKDGAVETKKVIIK